MFQSLRPNNQIFILNKDKATLEIGSVVSVSSPMPKYQVPPVFGQPQEMVVDLTVRVNNQDINYQKIPASSELADFGNGNIVLSDNRNAMNSEIMSLKQKSLNIINSIDHHKELLANYDRMLAGLNPEFAEKQQQQAEINELKMQVNDLTKGISDLMKMNKDLLAQFKTKHENTNENVGN